MKFLVMGSMVLAALTQPLLANSAATEKLNALRTSKGLARLEYSEPLEAAAKAHALDMAQHDYFAHEGRNGSSVGDRVRKQGYRWCYVAENLTKGQRSLDQVMKGWENSPGHYKNMVSSQAAEFGLFEGPDRIWAMVLAAPC